MGTVYTIGEVEKITGISKDRLRNYDKKEILKPMQEVHNGYRQYSEQDIIDILGVEHFRGMDLGLKEIKAIHDNGSVEYLHEQILQKKEQVEEEIKKLQDILSLLNGTKVACERIIGELDQYSIREMPRFRVLGKLLQSNFYEEYEQLHECKQDGVPIIKSMMRKITFSDEEITSNEMLIIEDNCDIEEMKKSNDKCLYMITEEKVDEEDIKEGLFSRTQEYLRKQRLKSQGVVFIKPLLINYSFQKLTTYLEIYVPLKA